jgi:hypothetical protein
MAKRERERHNSDNNITILMMRLMSHSTIDIPVASVCYVTSEAVVNTHTQSVGNNGPSLRSVSW